MAVQHHGRGALRVPGQDPLLGETAASAAAAQKGSIVEDRGVRHVVDGRQGEGRHAHHERREVPWSDQRHVIRVGYVEVECGRQDQAQRCQQAVVFFVLCGAPSEGQTQIRMFFV